jgi:hypothetical protein
MPKESNALFKFSKKRLFPNQDESISEVPIESKEKVKKLKLNTLTTIKEAFGQIKPTISIKAVKSDICPLTFD